MNPSQPTQASKASSSVTGIGAPEGGGKLQSASRFSALEAEVLLDPKTRAEAKKERRRAERGEGKDQPTLEDEGHEQDQLEKQLSIAHSTAPIRKTAASKKPKRLSVADIDEMTTVKQLRRALVDRGEKADKWDRKPDELKQLRAYAKSLRSICLQPVGAVRTSRFFENTAKGAEKEEGAMEGLLNMALDAKEAASAVALATASSLAAAASSIAKVEPRRPVVQEAAVRKAKMQQLKIEKQDAAFNENLKQMQKKQEKQAKQEK